MASRRRAREFALQALYTADVSDRSLLQALKGLWDGQVEGEGFDGSRPAEAEEIQYAERICSGVDQKSAEVDAMIEKASVNWRLTRMPVVDRNILRLATYELLECEDVPPNVSINEAVELAKRFGEKDSRAFVNGILDRIATETGRGGRRQNKKAKKS